MNEVRPSKPEDPESADEIIHITQGFVPLSRLLTRLAQVTHNALQDKVAELSQMPLAVPDGSSSAENLAKKSALLSFASDSHSKWVKALVIADWSRKAKEVSKLIDLKFYLDQKRMQYDAALDNIVNVKRDLSFARMPSPDFKTALQVLSTGQASWLPDLNYIEPPPLTGEEQLKWMGELNTILSLRLNLEDFESIPPAFRDYDIDSGRVTFKVPGEFEVDLTIADDDVEKQFWFIDFRFAFNPAAANLPETLRMHVESCVNDALRLEGLKGCYQFLHEFVLTYKINELKRQAIQLNRGSWTGNLKIEPLNRALAIQYWTNRGSGNGPKSWVLVAVESSDRKDTKNNGTSRLVARWYRDNKEMKDVNIPLDVENLSADSLLRDVVELHIEHILQSIHDKLAAAGRFMSKEAKLNLKIAREDSSASSLAMQVGFSDEASLLLESATGSFSIKPHSRFTLQYEYQLNNSSGSAEDGATCLENVRCAILEDELNRKGSQMGWLTRKAPLSGEELRHATGIRDWTRTITLQRQDWDPRWCIVVFLGMSGDAWWLIDSHRDETSRGTRFHAKLPFNQGPPKLSDAFWDNLTLFTTGMIAQAIDLADLHRNGVKGRINEVASWSLLDSVALPTIDIALSGICPSMVSKRAEQPPLPKNVFATNDTLGAALFPNADLYKHVNQAWACDRVSVRLKTLEAASDAAETIGVPNPSELVRVSEAIISVRDPSRLEGLKPMEDEDAVYTPAAGQFSLRLRHRLAEPLLPVLRSRIKAVDRFVNFLEAVNSSKADIKTTHVSLSRVACSYAGLKSSTAEASGGDAERLNMTLDLSKDNITVLLDEDNPHLRMVDLLQDLANHDGGIWSLITWLPVSAHTLFAIQSIEQRWSKTQAEGKGHVKIFVRTLDWIHLMFTLSGPSGIDRKVTFDLKVQSRRAEALWSLSRVDVEVSPNDPFTTALQPVWSHQPRDGWIGFGNNAAGDSKGGVAKMLEAMDEAVVGVLNAGPTPVPLPVVKKPSNVVVLD